MTSIATVLVNAFQRPAAKTKSAALLATLLAAGSATAAEQIKVVERPVGETTVDLTTKGGG